MPRTPPGEREQLSNYQLQVLAEAAAGRTLQETAERIGRSHAAVASAVSVARRKLRAATVAAAVYEARDEIEAYFAKSKRRRAR